MFYTYVFTCFVAGKAKCGRERREECRPPRLRRGHNFSAKIMRNREKASGPQCRCGGSSCSAPLDDVCDGGSAEKMADLDSLQKHFPPDNPPMIDNMEDYEYLDTNTLQSLFLNMSLIDPIQWNETFFPDVNGTFWGNLGDYIDLNSTSFTSLVMPPSNIWGEGGQYRRPPRHWSDLNSTEKDAYLQQAHGPRELDRRLAVPMTVFYVVLFFAGIPGNLLTCLIIIWNSYMRAPPNFFLFNLAVADIITLSVGKKDSTRHSLSIIFNFYKGIPLT
jgi:hypothetical protein